MNAKLIAMACLVAISTGGHAQSIRVVPEAFPIQGSPVTLPIRPM